MSAEPSTPIQGRVLIVDDDAIVAESLGELVRAAGCEPELAHDADAALAALARADQRPDEGFAIAIVDLALPGVDGTALLRDIRARNPAVAVVMLTGYGTVESAVQALRLGACDYLTKPVRDADLRQSLQRAAWSRALRAPLREQRRRLDRREAIDGGLIGSDPRMQKVYELVRAVAPTRTTVLMTGESGTGKSLVASEIHRRSPRRDKPYVELSCGSIPETLLESELFGHVKGAFTGAHAEKIGRFLAADGGTIFLDEINSASPSMQLKLLRVLQERRFEPVGSTKTVEVDARVVLASNQPLERLVEKGEFRQDLYYRINVVAIELPPLRERPGDIRPLATAFLAQQTAALGRVISGYSPEAIAALERYHFPGNVRELQNLVERAAVLARGGIIGLDDLPDWVARPTAPAIRLEPAHAWTPMPLEEALREPERRILLAALEANAWNRQKTADLLKINRTTLYKKMKSHGLLREDGRIAG